MLGRKNEVEGHTMTSQGHMTKNERESEGASAQRAISCGEKLQPAEMVIIKQSWNKYKVG